MASDAQPYSYSIVSLFIFSHLLGEKAQDITQEMPFIKINFLLFPSYYKGKILFFSLEKMDERLGR